MAQRNTKFQKEKSSSHIAHFQHTKRLNNQLIDYSVSRLFNNRLVAGSIIDKSISLNNRLIRITNRGPFQIFIISSRFYPSLPPSDTL